MMMMRYHFNHFKKVKMIIHIKYQYQGNLFRDLQKIWKERTPVERRRRMIAKKWRKVNGRVEVYFKLKSRNCSVIMVLFKDGTGKIILKEMKNIENSVFLIDFEKRYAQIKDLPMALEIINIDEKER